MRLCLVASSFAVAVLSAARPAVASEYCVVCFTPDARYRCMTNDGRTGAGTDQRAWMQCISQIARGGGHESCSIDRVSTAPCLGVVKDVDLATIDGAPPAAAAAAKPVPAPVGEPTPQAPGGNESGGNGSSDPPATDEPGVLEKSKQGLENAGSAIGNAAQKSWDCMSSLFKKC